MSPSKYNLARSATKVLFTQLQKNILPPQAAGNFLYNPKNFRGEAANTLVNRYKAGFLEPSRSIALHRPRNPKQDQHKANEIEPERTPKRNSI